MLMKISYIAYKICYTKYKISFLLYKIPYLYKISHIINQISFDFYKISHIIYKISISICIINSKMALQPWNFLLRTQERGQNSLVLESLIKNSLVNEPSVLEPLKFYCNCIYLFNLITLKISNEKLGLITFFLINLKVHITNYQL